MGAPKERQRGPRTQLEGRIAVRAEFCLVRAAVTDGWMARALQPAEVHLRMLWARHRRHLKAVEGQPKVMGRQWKRGGAATETAGKRQWQGSDNKAAARQSLEAIGTIPSSSPSHASAIFG